MSDHKLAADVDSCQINTNHTIEGKMSDIWSDEETILSSSVRYCHCENVAFTNLAFSFFFMFYAWFHTVYQVFDRLGSSC